MILFCSLLFMNIHPVLLSEEPVEIQYRQLPLNGVVIDNIPYYGHDELSTTYSTFDQDNQFIGFAGCYMADDFADQRGLPIVKIKWWGSYLENEIMEPVTRFLIAFETDVPAVGQPGDIDYVPSHPGEVIGSQILNLSGSTPLNQGEYSETPIGSGGPPCYESLYEYEAVLENPFLHDQDTVYWLKIIALIDIPPDRWHQIEAILNQTGMALYDFLNLPYLQQQPYGLEQPLTRWGWHNRDYTIQDPLASIPPGVVPGEHDASLLSWTLPICNPPIEVWHFQDNAVAGDVFIDDQMPLVEQPTWQEQYYKYSQPLCSGAGQGVDGPEGIETYSKDLAFELWRTDCRLTLTPAELVDYNAYVAVGQDPSCWCWKYHCRGDADHDGEGTLTKYRIYTGDMNVILKNWKRKFTSNPPADPCADVARDSEGAITKYRVYINDMNRVLSNWKKKDYQLTPCPSSLEY